MLIQVRRGKGAKDRTVMLPAPLLRILRTYWRLARPKEWSFPGRDETRPIDVQVLHAACRSAARRAEREADLLPLPYFHVVFTLPPPAAGNGARKARRSPAARASHRAPSSTRMRPSSLR